MLVIQDFRAFRAIYMEENAIDKLFSSTLSSILTPVVQPLKAPLTRAALLAWATRHPRRRRIAARSSGVESEIELAFVRASALRPDARSSVAPPGPTAGCGL
jgi:hypothetical protein